MRGCPQQGEAGIIHLWNSKNFSNSENSRLPITPSVINPSNERVISGNKNEMNVFTEELKTSCPFEQFF
jgi:hypothetical protein